MKPAYSRRTMKLAEKVECLLADLLDVAVTDGDVIPYRAHRTLLDAISVTNLISSGKKLANERRGS